LDDRLCGGVDGVLALVAGRCKYDRQLLLMLDATQTFLLLWQPRIDYKGFLPYARHTTCWDSVSFRNHVPETSRCLVLREPSATTTINTPKGKSHQQSIGETETEN